MSKNKMSKGEIAVKFAELVDLSEQKNRELKKQGSSIHSNETSSQG